MDGSPCRTLRSMCTQPQITTCLPPHTATHAGKCSRARARAHAQQKQCNKQSVKHTNPLHSCAPVSCNQIGAAPDATHPHPLCHRAHTPSATAPTPPAPPHLTPLWEPPPCPRARVLSLQRWPRVDHPRRVGPYGRRRCRCCLQSPAPECDRGRHDQLQSRSTAQWYGGTTRAPRAECRGA